MDADTRRKVVRRLKLNGFDRTTSYKSGHVSPRCSQCEVLVISGVATHEIGCQNHRQRTPRGRFQL